MVRLRGRRTVPPAGSARGLARPPSCPHPRRSATGGACAAVAGQPAVPVGARRPSIPCGAGQRPLGRAGPSLAARCGRAAGRAAAGRVAA